MATDVRQRLLAAAERLFAERGVDAVSLREINAASGARNTSALQYHFGDRHGVIAAVLAKHRPEVEARRHALLDEAVANGDPDLRSLASALVRPAAAKLAEGDAGAGYLQLVADLINRPRPVIDGLLLDDDEGSIGRWRELVGPLLPPGGAELHHRFTAIQLVHTELARRARRTPRGDDRLFVGNLVDLAAAVLATPVSDETRRLLEARDGG
ncbi:MAG: TetR/AcrR family transcriptional regulator [Solirubrobacteraceae bacterium]|nr:TetR/AcrR family transcriptional regulator [Solirubrobacteraceae bacterium]